MNHHATIRRGHISEDGFSELYNLGPLMKGTIQIRFIDEWVYLPSPSRRLLTSFADGDRKKPASMEEAFSRSS